MKISGIASTCLLLVVGIYLHQSRIDLIRDAMSGPEPSFDAADLLNSARQNARQNTSVIGTVSERSETKKEQAVITIDAGSSGTRVYEVRYSAEDEGCSYRSITKLFESDQALAKSAAAALPGILDDLSNRHPQIRGLAVKAVGTGGFRNLDAGDGQNCAQACARKRKEIQAALAVSHANARFHVASGTEEAELGWLSAAALTGQDSHAVIDIGGSTVELAFKKGKLPQSFMANIGTDAVAARVPECASPSSNSSACINGIERLILADELAAKLYFAQTAGATNVIGLGGAFRRLAQLAEADVRSFNPYENLGRIESIANAACRRETTLKTCSQLSLELLLIKKFRVNRILNASVEIGAAFAGFQGLQTPQTFACRNYTF